MTWKVFAGILLISLAINSCSESKREKENNPITELTMSNPYPFQAVKIDGRFTIIAAIENDDLFNKYYPFFESFGYEGNGYCWEGHIIQIIEKKDKELLDHIEFDPEAGTFFAYADSKEAQIRFINLLSPIFSDLQQLEEYVKSADRSRIDD